MSLIPHLSLGALADFPSGGIMDEGLASRVPAHVRRIITSVDTVSVKERLM